ERGEVTEEVVRVLEEAMQHVRLVRAAVSAAGIFFSTLNHIRRPERGVFNGSLTIPVLTLLTTFAQLANAVVCCNSLRLLRFRLCRKGEWECWSGECPACRIGEANARCFGARWRRAPR